MARRHHLAASLPRRPPGVGGRGRGRAAPGRSCSGGTPISAASADGRWAPARPPPPAAQWARSLRRTMRPGRAPAARAEGRWPGPCAPVRAACPWDAPGRPQTRGLRGSAAGPGARQPIVRGRRPEPGWACSTALGAASFLGPRSERHQQGLPGCCGPVRPCALVLPSAPSSSRSPGAPVLPGDRVLPSSPVPPAPLGAPGPLKLAPSTPHPNALSAGPRPGPHAPVCPLPSVFSSR